MVSPGCCFSEEVTVFGLCPCHVREEGGGAKAQVQEPVGMQARAGPSCLPAAEDGAGRWPWASRRGRADRRQLASKQVGGWTASALQKERCFAVRGCLPGRRRGTGATRVLVPSSVVPVGAGPPPSRRPR